MVFHVAKRAQSSSVQLRGDTQETAETETAEPEIDPAHPEADPSKRRAGRPIGSSPRKLFSVSMATQTSETTMTNPKFATPAGRKVAPAQAPQQLYKEHEGFRKQEAPRKKKETTRLGASRKAEWKRTVQDAKFIGRQLTQKQAEAKNEGELNNHTCMYILQLKPQLQDAEPAQQELLLSLKSPHVQEQALIPTQMLTDTLSAVQPTVQPEQQQQAHAAALTYINYAAWHAWQ